MNYILNVVNPEECTYFGIVKRIRILGSKGELGIYPGHVQLLSFIQSGIMYFLDRNEKAHYIYLSGGILEIQPTVTNILTNISSKISSLDKKSIETTEKILRNRIENSYLTNKKKILKNLSCELNKIKYV
ncbi:MAG: ATP synthase F1 subunit epsilon [Buchnera aphidicola (Nurudea yanoniella)]